MTLLAVHAHAAADLRRLLLAGFEGDTRFVIPFGCIGEIWRAATEPPPGLAVPPADVADFLALWSQRGEVLMPGAQYFEVLGGLLARLRPLGARVFDVLIAAVCIEHEIDEIWTLDMGFPRDPRLRVVNPLEPLDV